jgi:hypothetical protein
MREKYEKCYSKWYSNFIKVSNVILVIVVAHPVFERRAIPVVLHLGTHDRDISGRHNAPRNGTSTGTA